MTTIRLLLLAVFLVMPVLADRTKLKPEFNIFSLAQDVELGLQVSKEMEARAAIVRNPKVNNYLDALGRRLVMKAPGGAQFRFSSKSLMIHRSMRLGCRAASFM